MKKSLCCAVCALFAQVSFSVLCAQAGGANAAPTVMVSKSELVSESPVKRYVGAVEACQSVQIVPRVTGELWKVNFQEGEILSKGALLYEIEDTNYRAAVEGLYAQKEALEATLLFATREYERSKNLRDKNVVTIAAHDRAVMEMNTAKASLKQVKASILTAETNLSYTKIYAKITGRIGKSTVTPGNLLAPQSGVLATMEQLAPIYVRFAIAERIFRENFGNEAGMKERAQVQVVLADGTTFGETGRITLVDNKVDASTNTITVWATFANTSLTLLPGGFVTVQLTARKAVPQVGVLPSALVAEADGFSVYVINDKNVVERHPVKLGSIVGKFQLVESDLKGGETVVADGVHKVRPGMTVTPVKMQ